MTIYVFGNPDLPSDSVPLSMLPELRAAFPEHTFVVLDPNEDWDVPPHMIIIDTVVGIDRVTAFHDLTAFVATPRITCHDFDAYANLLLMKKLGKIDRVTIIGVPYNSSPTSTPDVIAALEHAAPKA